MRSGLLDAGFDDDLGAEKLLIPLHLGIAPSASHAPAVQPLVAEQSPSVAMTLAAHASTEASIVRFAREHPVMATAAAVVVVGGLGWAIMAALGGKALIGAAAL